MAAAHTADGLRTLSNRSIVFNVPVFNVVMRIRAALPVADMSPNRAEDTRFGMDSIAGFCAKIRAPIRSRFPARR